MHPLRALTARPEPWRLLRLVLALVVTVVLTVAVGGGLPDLLVDIPPLAVLPLLLAFGSAFAGLVIAAARRGFRGSPAVSFAFSLAAAATATTLTVVAIQDWQPARPYLRFLLVDPLVAHRFTVLVGAALSLFCLLRRHELTPGRERFALELFPVLVWAYESASNHLGFFDACVGELPALLWAFVEIFAAEVVALVVAILFVALIAHLRPTPRPRGFPAALLAVATILLDRALSLGVLAWWTNHPHGS
jgi:hypothetical protein